MTDTKMRGSGVAGHANFMKPMAASPKDRDMADHVVNGIRFDSGFLSNSEKARNGQHNEP